MTDRRKLLAAGILALAAAPVFAVKSGRIYDRYGSYQGRVDENGRMYDNRGSYLGRRD